MSAQAEASCDGVIEKLRAGLNARIDQINAEHSDPVAVERVPDEFVFFGVRSEFPYPCVMVFPDDTASENDHGLRIDWRHKIVVMGWAADGTEEALQRKLLRFERAIRDTILANRAADFTGGFGLGHLRDRRTRVFQPHHGMFEHACVSEFWVTQEQDL